VTDTDVLQLIADRDQAYETADKLAAALAELLGTEIGEHSNMNDPWRNALSDAQTAIAERKGESVWVTTASIRSRAAEATR
jgi:hypothetical protein